LIADRGPMATHRLPVSRGAPSFERPAEIST
jgi:hypothetical protein